MVHTKRLLIVGVILLALGLTAFVVNQSESSFAGDIIINVIYLVCTPAAVIFLMLWAFFSLKKFFGFN